MGEGTHIFLQKRNTYIPSEKESSLRERERERERDERGQGNYMILTSIKGPDLDIKTRK
jgi:hypothetical protein